MIVKKNSGWIRDAFLRRADKTCWWNRCGGEGKEIIKNESDFGLDQLCKWS